VSSERKTLRLVVVGEVDHGKSTLLGRLLHDAGQLMDGKAEYMRNVSRKRGREEEWAFVLDAFQAERDQGVTIDATTVWFRTEHRDCVVVDAPGHREFVRNMVSGAADADAALLLIDATEGVREQTRRHLQLLALLGVGRLVVTVNKMDLVGYDQPTFGTIAKEVGRLAADLGLAVDGIVPVVAKDGGNLMARSQAMPWHDGPVLVEIIDRLEPKPGAESLPLRFALQDVYRFEDRRLLAGRIDSGTLKAGDTLLFSPGDVTARVRSIEQWNGPALDSASAGQSIGITLDQQVFAERGSVASHADGAPVLTNVLRGTVFWLDREPLAEGRRLTLRIATQETPITVQAIESVRDLETLEQVPGQRIERNGIGAVLLHAPRTLALDDHHTNPAGGRFVLVDGYTVVGGGLVSLEGCPDQRRLLTRRATNISEVAHTVGREQRARRNNHSGAVIWLTGLSGAGKSTLAMRLERDLFDRGMQVYVLDGDNLRTGLNADLGFSPKDRTENIRRVSEVAALFADAGCIAITAFISPFRDGRQHARNAAGGHFHEIHVDAPVETCEARDPKGLYRRARAGEIAEFTGVSSPYEAPEHAELVIDTSARSLDECAAVLLDYVLRVTRVDTER
jgi:bifunctional enzyme CysN/CysC